MLAKLINYFKETRAELRNVKWPTKKQTINFTIMVIAISFGVAVFLGFFDTIFSWLLKKFIL